MTVRHSSLSARTSDARVGWCCFALSSASAAIVPALKLIIAGPQRLTDRPAGVEYLGPVAVHSMAAVFARATMFVLPTLREPYGLAFLDAMACGLPCVGTDIEAVPEIVEQGRTGLLVPPGDDVALARAIATLLDDTITAHEMGDCGRRSVMEDFRWSHVAARLEVALRVASEVDEGHAAAAAPRAI